MVRCGECKHWRPQEVLWRADHYYRRWSSMYSGFCRCDVLSRHVWPDRVVGVVGDDDVFTKTEFGCLLGESKTAELEGASQKK